MAGGRPTKMTEITVKKLEEAFSIGCSDSEACFHAGISKPTLYDYCKLHPDFSDRKELLKSSPMFKAKKVVDTALDGGDVKTAQWVIEKKEGRAKQQTEISGPDGSAIKTDNKITIEFIDSTSMIDEPETNR